ncbi:MAG: helix-turn-helix transcriptional regulator [Culicoidibacterales bacterium]
MLTLSHQLYQALVIYDTRRQKRIIDQYFNLSNTALIIQKQEWTANIAIIYYKMASHDGISLEELDDMFKLFSQELNPILTSDKLHHYIQTTISSLDIIMKRQFRLTPSKEVNTAISYMYINLFHKKTVEEIATATNISQRHLNKLFQTYTSMSIHQYYLKLKVERAAFLIQVEHMTTSELAQLLQFYDESHFIRVFKKHFTLSPKQWQQQLSAV